ncbi:unnamed protein product [Caretta caretta]
MAKANLLWLRCVLADMVHPDQIYTIPGHTIFDNLYLVQDLLELGCRDALFALLPLDQEKAFDWMDHGYLLGTLQAFGFRPRFVGFLQVLYASAECLVRLNWILTAPVTFEQGVHQGCPLLGQLYSLAIEPFLRKRLTGLVLHEPEVWLVLPAYTDDVLLVVQGLDDLVWVEACQAVCSAASSAQVNWVELWPGGRGQVMGELPPTHASGHLVEPRSAALSWRLSFCHASISSRELARFRGQDYWVVAGFRGLDGTAPVPLPLGESTGA